MTSPLIHFLFPELYINSTTDVPDPSLTKLNSKEFKYKLVMKCKYVFIPAL